MPPYIKEQGGGQPAPVGTPQEGSPTRTTSPSRIPPRGEEGEGRRGRGERKGGRRPPFLVLFGLKGRGRGLPWLPLSLSTKAHRGPLVPPGVPITLGHSGFIRNFSGTLPVSEYSRPIYQSLCLDHFETPRHVHDHIRDSEQPSVQQNT